MNKKFRILIFSIFVILILYLNISTRGFSVEMIMISIYFSLLIFGVSKNFLKDWIPFLIGFWGYESTRGIADDFASMLGIKPNFNIVFNLEKSLFFFLKDVPTILLQQNFPFSEMPKFFLITLFFFYSSFFWIWAGTAFLIWLKKPEYFKNFVTSFLLMSFFGNFVFAFFPTMPPWYASQIGKLPELERVMWSAIFPNHGVSFVSFWDSNDFAAFPSHHFGWTFFSALWITKLFGKKWVWSFIFPFVILFSIVYGAEHYFVDAVFGGIISFVFFRIFSKNSLEYFARI